MEKAKTFNEVISPVAKSFSEIAKKNADIAKFNPYHDRLGRFTTSGAAASFTYRPGASKAHDLAIAREKERTAAAAATPEQKRAAALKSVEDKIRKQDFESAAIIDRNGNQVLFKDGEAAEVSFNNEECQMMRGATLTHNHPSSSTFSAEDVQTFVRRDLQEIRAAGRNGTTYCLKRTADYTESLHDYELRKKQFDFIDKFYSQRQKAYAKARVDMDKAGFRDKLMSGQMTQEQANSEYNKFISNHVNKYLTRYAKNYGFEFSVEGGAK